ncbi:hypothetical protein Nepgr_002087 [Nepenthes gracilis]|uniref:Uncharacterized protein n=1 Tax=Nepenthes gracilis TaxID=150966 RepID=A0AAD3P8C0_NEPGR|nr:hypothetical protein Nepgr_002087 [Nepenthes gracilis]
MTSSYAAMDAMYLGGVLIFFRRSKILERGWRRGGTKCQLCSINPYWHSCMNSKEMQYWTTGIYTDFRD